MPDTAKFIEALNAYDGTQNAMIQFVSFAQQEMGDDWFSNILNVFPDNLSDDLKEKLNHVYRYYGASLSWGEIQEYLNQETPLNAAQIQERLPVLEYWLSFFNEPGLNAVAQLKEKLAARSDSTGTDTVSPTHSDGNSNTQETDLSNIQEEPLPDQTTENVSAEQADNIIENEPMTASIAGDDESLISESETENMPEPTFTDSSPEEIPSAEEIIPAEETQPATETQPPETEAQPPEETLPETFSSLEMPSDNPNQTPISESAYASGDPNATYDDPNAAYDPNATYDDPNAAYDPNATYDDPNAAYDPNATYDDPNAAYDPNATYDDPNAAYDPNATYDDPNAAYDPNATYDDPNAAYDPNATYDDANAAYDPNATYDDPNAAYDPNATYDDANAAYDPNATYDDPNAAYDPNATYDDPNAAYDPNATYDDPNAAYDATEQSEADQMSAGAEEPETNEQFMAKKAFRQLDFVNTVHSWIDARCIDLGKIEIYAYKHYGFLIDAMEQAKKDIQEVLSSPVYYPALENIRPNGLKILQNSLIALEKDLETAYDNCPTDSTPLINEEMDSEEARQMLGMIDTSNKKEYLGPAPDGFEMVEDPYET